MEQDMHTKQKNKFGVIMLLSAFILGLAFFILSLTANNGKQVPVTTQKVEVTTESSKETSKDSGYIEIKETSNTPKEINNEVLNSIDSDMRELENSLDDISDLEL